MKAGIAMAQNARRPLTCDSAPERAHLYRSRGCFASSMDTKIAQNRRKFHTKLPQKMRGPVLQWSKTEAVERPAKMHQNAFIFLVPRVALFTSWMQKSLKIVRVTVVPAARRANSKCIVSIITFFRRSRKNIKKHDLRIRMAPK